MNRSFEGLKIAETRIEIPGLAAPTRLMHITDMHLTHTDERDAPRTHEIARERTRLFQRYADCPIRALFERILAQAGAAGADAVVLTGDIVDFPSRANLEALDLLLNKSGLNYAFVTGNHDWWPEYLDGRTGRHAEYMERLAPFMDVVHGCGVKVVNGVRILTLDDSEYQISPEQLGFVEEQLSGGAPCLLFLHIPLYAPSLVPDVLNVWKSPILAGVPADLPRGPKGTIDAPLPLPSTQAFLRLLARREFSNLYGVFAGHVHFAHEDALCGDVIQSVTAPGYSGVCRLITLG